MAEIKIQDEEALKAIAEAIRQILIQNSEYFFNVKSFDLQRVIVDKMREAIGLIVKNEIDKILIEKNISNQVKDLVVKCIEEGLIIDLLGKVKVSVSGY